MSKVRSCYIYSNWGLDTDWMDQCQTTKAWMCFQGLLPKILGSSSQFQEMVVGVLVDK